MWMDRQEAAFASWINATLAPPLAHGGTPSARRLRATLRAALWARYSRCAVLRDVMLRVEARVDGGQLRFANEVRGAGRHM